MNKLSKPLMEIVHDEKFNKTAITIIIVFVFSVVYSAFYLAGSFEKYDNSITDFIMTHSNNQDKVSDKIVYLVQDDECIEKAAQKYNMGYPWKRSAFARLINFLRLAGAKVIVMDYFFSEKSVYQNYEPDDLIFVESISKANNVILPYALYTNTALFNDAVIPIKNSSQFRSTKEMSSLPLPDLIEAAARIGFVNSPLDKDDILRKIPLIAKSFNQYYYSLSLVTILEYFNIKKVKYDAGKLIIGDRTIPLDSAGNVRLKYYGSTDLYNDYYFYDTLKIYDHMKELYEKYKGKITCKQFFENSKNVHLVRDKLRLQYPALIGTVKKKEIDQNPPEAFRDKIVIMVSMVSGGKTQIVTNPFSRKDPGAHAYGTFINNFINNDFLHKPNKYYIIVIMIILSIFIALATLNWPPKYVILIIFALLLINSIAAFVLYRDNIIFDVFTLSISILSTYMLAMIIDHLYIHSQLKSREQVIFKLSAHVHNNLKNKLDAAKDFYELYNQKGNEKHLKKIDRLINVCRQDCKNLLYLFHNKECSFDDLAKEMQFRASRQFCDKDIKFDFSIMDGNKKLGLNVVHDSLDMYTEILNNINKHSEASNVLVDLSYDKKYFNLTVKDNGVGFNVNESLNKRGCHGLSIMTRLAKYNKHILNIESSFNNTIIDAKINFKKY